MAAANDNLKGKQSQVLAALVGGATVLDAAAGAGINPLTVHRWLKKESFATAYREARRDVVTQAGAIMQSHAQASATTIASIMNDIAQPASVRLRAAIAIQELSARWQENDDQAERIEAIEARLTTNGDPKGKVQRT